jgi:hypothetical protein
MTLIVAGVLFISGCRSTCTDPQPAPPDSGTARKVAVLISTEYAESMDNIYDADAWYDLVHTYCMLRANGFTDDNIWVLYAYGEDGFYRRRSSCSKPKPADFPPATDGPEVYYQQPFCQGLTDPAGGSLSVDRKITDIPLVLGRGSDLEKNGELRLERFFRCLESGCDPNVEFGFECKTLPYIQRLTRDDFLFVWWRGHGVRVEPTQGETSTVFSLTGGREISSETLVGWLANTEAKRCVLSVESCHSGCTKDVLLAAENAAIASRSVLLASSSCLKKSNRSYEPDVYHGVWSYWVAGSLQGWLPNGVSNVLGPTGNQITIGLVKGGPIYSTFDEAAKATEFLLPSQNPEKADKNDLAKKTEMDNPDPAGAVGSIQ